MTNNYNNKSEINTNTVVVDDEDGPNTFIDRKQVLKKQDDDVKEEKRDFD